MEPKKASCGKMAMPRSIRGVSWGLLSPFRTAHGGPRGGRSPLPNMSARWFRVSLDLERIRRSLSRADAAEYPIEYVLSWLTESGFRHAGDGAWIVREADLGAVEPDEVRTIEELPEGPAE